MAKILLHSIVILLIYLEQIVSSQKQESSYGPSIASLASADRKIGPRQPKKVSLEDYPNYSVVLPLLTGKCHGTSSEILRERGTIKTGRFVVKAPKGFGVMAVIQQIDFPADPLDFFQIFDFGMQKICRDYIQFTEGRSLGTGDICGKVAKDSKEEISADMIGPRSFNSSSGKIIVLFNHGDIQDLLLFNSVKKDSADVRSRYEYKLEIVFTAYKDCNDDPFDDTYLPCEHNPDDKNLTCINSKLICDNHINCGISSAFAADEKGCPTPPASNDPEMKIDPLIDDGGENFTTTTTASFLSRIWKDPLQQSDELFGINVSPRPSLEYQDSFPYNNKPHPNHEHIHNYYDGNQQQGEEQSMFDLIELQLTPTGTILLIILTIAAVMVLSVIVRFCCYRCVGKHPQNCPASNVSSPIYGAISSSMRQNNRNINSSNSDFIIDTPPAYHDLFPTSFLKTARTPSNAEIPAPPTTQDAVSVIVAPNSTSSLPRTENANGEIPTVTVTTALDIPTVINESRQWINSIKMCHK